MVKLCKRETYDGSAGTGAMYVGSAVKERNVRCFNCARGKCTLVQLCKREMHIGSSVQERNVRIDPLCKKEMTLL